MVVWCETRTKGERAQLRSWDKTRLAAVIAWCAYKKCLRQWYADGVLGPADRYLPSLSIEYDTAQRELRDVKQ